MLLGTAIHNKQADLFNQVNWLRAGAHGTMDASFTDHWMITRHPDDLDEETGEKLQQLPQLHKVDVNLVHTSYCIGGCDNNNNR